MAAGVLLTSQAVEAELHNVQVVLIQPVDAPRSPSTTQTTTILRSQANALGILLGSGHPSIQPTSTQWAQNQVVSGATSRLVRTIRQHTGAGALAWLIAATTGFAATTAFASAFHSGSGSIAANCIWLRQLETQACSRTIQVGV